MQSCDNEVFICNVGNVTGRMLETLMLLFGMELYKCQCLEDVLLSILLISVPGDTWHS